MLAALDERLLGLSQELDALRREREAHGEAATEIERLRERNQRELAGYLLPDLDDEDLASLERRLHYPGLLAIKRAFERRLAAIHDERLAVEANPDFAERELRRVDIDTQLAELDEPAQSFRRDRAPWEESPHFIELLNRGWFRENYDAGLFDWLRDWRACSLLMAHLEEKTGKSFPDDDDVKNTWRALVVASEPVFALVAQLEEHRERIAALERRHTELLAAPDTLHQELWATLAEAVSDHLESCPDDVLLSLGRSDPMLATFLKKAIGLKTQASYLKELAYTRIDALLRTVEAERRKTHTKRVKLANKQARGKYVAITPNQIQATRTLPRDKWQKRRTSLGRTRDRIASFESWDRGAFTADFLWWELFAKNDPGSDLRSVQLFHAAHPGWSLSTFTDPLASRTSTDRAIEAAAAMDLAAPETADQMVDQMADRLAGSDPDLFDAS